MADDGGLSDAIRAQDAAAASRRAAEEAAEARRQEVEARIAAAGRAFAEQARLMNLPLDEIRVHVGTRKEQVLAEPRGGFFRRTHETVDREVPVYETREAWLVSEKVTEGHGSKERLSGFTAYVLPTGEVIGSLNPPTPLPPGDAEEVIQKMAALLREGR
jgi:hypothetical protein